jgi:hypothetical protein
MPAEMGTVGKIIFGARLAFKAADINRGAENRIHLGADDSARTLGIR